MKTMRDDGWLKVQNGITTIEEVIRVTQTDEPLEQAKNIVDKTKEKLLKRQ